MSLQTMRERLNYQGGNQEQRMINDKLVSLKRALLYSYQAATARLADGREFRCLINPDNLKPDYDNKIISIPFKDVCLNKPRQGKTTQGEEVIGLKPGDVFEWVETGTYWIVYLRYYEEDAYFRADIRKCEAETKINDNTYKLYIRGPVETTIQWNQKKGDTWNDINYSLIVYITKNEETLQYLHRFSKLEIDGKMWEVKVIDPYHGDGVIELSLGEWYNNTIEKEGEKAKVIDVPSIPPIDTNAPYIDGPKEVRVFDTDCKYTIVNCGDNAGTWLVNSKKAVIASQTPTSVYLSIASGKSGSFNLIYRRDNEKDVILPIVIKSF